MCKREQNLHKKTTKKQEKTVASKKQAKKSVKKAPKQTIAELFFLRNEDVLY